MLSKISFHIHFKRLRTKLQRRKSFGKKLKSLSEEGYDVTWVQCEMKFKNLKREFVSTEDNNRKTGAEQKHVPSTTNWQGYL